MSTNPLVVVLCLSIFATAAPAAQETPKKVDPNSAEVVVRGCANGRALVPQPVEGSVPTPATLYGRPMRLNGPKDLLKDIERQKGKLIEVSGLIKRADLRGAGPGVTVGRTRITVGGASPMSSDPTRSDPTRQAMGSVIHLDVSGFRVLSPECSASGR